MGWSTGGRDVGNQARDVRAGLTHRALEDFGFYCAGNGGPMEDLDLMTSNFPGSLAAV